MELKGYRIDENKTIVLRPELAIMKNNERKKGEEKFKSTVQNLNVKPIEFLIYHTRA